MLRNDLVPARSVLAADAPAVNTASHGLRHRVCLATAALLGFLVGAPIPVARAEEAPPELSVGGSPAEAPAAAPAPKKSEKAAAARSEVPPKGPKKEAGPEDRGLRGVVVVERAGQPLALGAALAGDGRVLTALSPLGTGNDLDVRFADGSIARVKVGHHDRTWDLALLVPQTGKWAQGLLASSKDPVRPDAAVRAFSASRSKVQPAAIVLRAHRTLLGGDDKPLENAIELGSRILPNDLGSPVVDEDGRVVAVLGRGCAPAENRACTPVAFGVPMSAIRTFLRTIPPTAVPPAPWLGIQGVSDTTGVAKGVRIISIAPQSPAEAAHLKAGERGDGDMILAVDGSPVTTPEGLVEAIRAHGAGDKVPLMLFGEGKYHEVAVTLKAAPDGRATPPAAPNPAELPPANEVLLKGAAPAKKKASPPR